MGDLVELWFTYHLYSVSIMNDTGEPSAPGGKGDSSGIESQEKEAEEISVRQRIKTEKGKEHSVALCKQNFYS